MVIDWVHEHLLLPIQPKFGCCFMLEIKIFLHTIRISTIGDIYNSGELAHPIPKWPQIPNNLVCRFDLK